MNEIKSTGDAAAFARGSAGDYKAAIDLCTEDGRLRRFKYLLERLTVGGLRMDEVPPLRKVGEAVFGGKDPSAAAARVLNHASATPLAVAIASAALKDSNASRQRSLLGAVLGAHASVGMARGQADIGLVVYAAVIGSATGETTQMIHDFVGNNWGPFGEGNGDPS